MKPENEHLNALPDPAPAAPHDPYKMRTLEQIVSLFDGGDFLQKLLKGHADLQRALLDHKDEHGGKAKGTMTLTIGYDLGKQGDVAMSARVDFKTPQKPASNAAAFINDKGELTLYSPLMARMHSGPRNVKETPHDPETGEVIDA